MGLFGGRARDILRSRDLDDKDLKEAMSILGLVLFVQFIQQPPARPPNISQAHSTPAGARYLCNIPAGTNLRELRKEIESRVGKVSCEIVPGLVERGAAGLMGYKKNSEPFIELDQRVGETEAEVAHELLHFELDVESWPGRPALPPGMPNDYPHSITMTILWSELQHRVVEKEARRRKLAPDTFFKNDLEAHMPTDGGVSRLWALFPQYGAVELARDFAIDEADGAKVSQRLRQQNRSDVADAGELLDQELRGEALSKERSTATLQRCLAELWKRLPTYTLGPRAMAMLYFTYSGDGQ